MLKILSLFSGIGAFEKALENIDEPFELVNYCEIDKYASRAFSLIHAVKEGLNLGDITAVDTHDLPNDIDVITYGFPCQDISNAGKQKGFTDENGDITRSGLFYEALRIIEDTQPKFAIAENVKALTSKKIRNAGYTNYWALLNVKDYGIPQNRERVFIISIRDDINHGFSFPKPYELKLRLKDLLETNVDEKYYFPKADFERLIEHTFKNGRKSAIKQIGNIRPTKTRKNPNQGRVYDPDGIAPTLHCCGGGNLEPIVCEIRSDEGLRFFKDNVCGTLRTLDCCGGKRVIKDGRLRKITPKECFRLMGFDDRDVDILIDNGMSNTQLYKMAGNSIVVDVLEEIFVELLNQYNEVV